MDKSNIGYALAKQLPAARTIESSYGAIDLDDEMKTAIIQAIKPILKKRMVQQS